MSKLVTQSMSPESLLTVAGNILHRFFFESSRNNAKRLFTDLAPGDAKHLLRLTMEDNSELDVWLQLDKTECQGRINFGGFKAQLTVLLERIKQRLEAGEDANIYDSETGGEKIFNIPALVVDKGIANVMVLGLGPAMPARITLKLLYLDPAQFMVAAPEEAEIEN
jgi:hypothetical protein